MEYHFLLRALESIADTDVERARRLGVSTRAIAYIRDQMRRGIISKPLRRYAENTYWQYLYAAAILDTSMKHASPCDDDYTGPFGQGQ